MITSLNLSVYLNFLHVSVHYSGVLNLIPEQRRLHRFGDLEINFKKYYSRKKGRPLKLSPREYELLRCFIERQGEIISREELLKQIWGYDSYPDTRTVDAHIAKLRHKIEDNPEEPKLIVTVHGIGYKFL